MEKKDIFRILGVEETRDKEVIKQAYRKQLAEHHPEDDPEGFKQLRAAYEEACVLADAEDTRENEENGVVSPGDQWIAEAKDRYASLSARKDTEGWKSWLQEDYCMALDTAEDARDRFLQFAMEHFYYPEEVWKAFDREFRLVESREQLLERYPENFVNYIVWSIQSGVFIDFDLFEGDDDADIDGYIHQYFELKEAVGSGDIKKAEEVLKTLDSWPLHHIFADVERMKLAMQRNNQQELETYLCLFEAREDGNSYIRLMAAAAYEELGRWEDAESVYDALLDEMPDMYAAGLGKVRCLFHNGQYKEAKERTLDLLEISKNDDAAQKLMVKINEQLIADLLLRKDELTMKERLDLGWCYLQNEQYDKTIEIVESVEPDEEVQADYNNLAGRIYLYTQNEEKAFNYLEAWLHELEQLDETQPELKERKRRIPYAHFCIGLCWQKFSQTDPAGIEKALACMHIAVEMEKDSMMRMSYLSNEAEWMNKLQRYSDSIAICDRILEEDARYLPAYVMRQEASFKLRPGQSVIDDYYRIVELYPEYAPSYVLAAKTFIYYEAYQQAQKVIEAAENAGLHSDSLRYVKAKCQYYMVRSRDAMQDIADVYEELLSSEELNNEEKEQLRIDFSESLIYLRDYKTALVRVDHFMKEYPQNRTLLWIRADILNYLERYDEALKAYEETRTYFPKAPGLLCDLARCQMKNGRYEDAIAVLQSVMELDDSYKDVNGLMTEAYHQLLNRNDDPEMLKKALPYADKQIELTPTEYDYIQRGILYQDAGEPEKAMEDFLAALEKNPDSAYAANNLGFDYRLMDRFEDAVKMLERSLELRKDQNLSRQIVYQNLAVTWLIMERFDKAEEVLKENLKDNRSYGAEIMLGEVYHRAGRYQEALDVYEAMIKEYPQSEGVIRIEMAEVYASMGDSSKCGKIIKAQYKKYKSDVWYFSRYAECLSEIMRDYKKVLKLFEKVPETEDMNRKMQWQHYYIEALWRAGRKAEAAEALEDMLQMLAQYGEEKYYGIDDRPMHYFNTALCYFFGGQPDKAEALFRRMMEERRCRSCHYCKCFEALYGMGYICLLDGRADEAFEYFREALSVNPTDAICRYYGKEKRTQL